MIKSIATFLAAAALALLVAFTIPFSATDIGTNPIKEAIGFSTAKIGSLEISLNLILAIFVTVQGFLITLAALSLLSQITWFIPSRSKAPLSIIDAALRNYPQTFFLFFKQPWNKTSAAVALVFLPVIIDAVQHATVQSLVVQGVAENTGTTSYVYPNTSTIKALYEPLLSEEQGYFSGLSQIAAIAAANGFSAVANACSNKTRTCGTRSTNATTSLISCSSEVDCTAEVNNYHDFNVVCTRNETLATYPAGSYGWLNSSVSITRFFVSRRNYVNVVDWTMRRVDPKYWANGAQLNQTLIAAVNCKIEGAWATRVESQLRGTLSKSLVWRYDSAESSSAKNTTNVDPLSNLQGMYNSHLSSSMGYLHLALSRNIVGACRGRMGSSAVPYNCDRSLYLLSWASDQSRAENDVAMLEQEMRFTVEMIMNHLFINVMPNANGTGTCKNCSTRNARWVSLPAATVFFGVILGLVMLFAGTSIYLEKTHGCKDSLISADMLFTAFGGSCGSGEPIISLDKQGQITVEGASKELAYLIADQ
ncbi:hypothetical protein HDU81_000060 [Chytriomyces hyalinus]|nr:hypothetical protein HDU81_000060 [Chytriomyces hyalinus]